MILLSSFSACFLFQLNLISVNFSIVLRMLFVQIRVLQKVFFSSNASFDASLCFLFPRLGISLLFLPRENALLSMICNWWSGKIYFVTFTFSDPKIIILQIMQFIRIIKINFLEKTYWVMITIVVLFNLFVD